MNETWKKIPNYEDYEISNLGRIKTERPILIARGRALKYPGLRYLNPAVMNGYYVITFSVNGKRSRLFYIHRLLWELFVSPISEGMEIDHKNGNRLDNSFENLRLATPRQNLINRIPKKGSKTGYRGVSHTNGASTYTAKIKLNSKPLYLGSFRTKEEAALAYNEAAKKYQGDFAILNVVPT